MLIHYIRDANRNPVACVVSTKKGKVGWSVYHPDDYEEVQRNDYVYTDDVLVRIPISENGEPVMTKKKVSFSKALARKVAGEREADLRTAMRTMEESVPEDRTFSKNATTKVFVSDDHGFKIGPVMSMAEVVQENLKDELAFQIEYMHKLSLEYDPDKARAELIVRLLKKLKSLGWKA